MFFTLRLIVTTRSAKDLINQEIILTFNSKKPFGIWLWIFFLKNLKLCLRYDLIEYAYYLINHIFYVN